MSLRERGMHVFSVAAREGRVCRWQVLAADAHVARGRALVSCEPFCYPSASKNESKT
jgi:hypothetical protein